MPKFWQLVDALDDEDFLDPPFIDEDDGIGEEDEYVPDLCVGIQQSW